jgi:hypothetical protein
MKRVRWDIVAWIVMASIAFLVAALAIPGDRRIEFHVFVLVIGVILMSAAISAVAGAVPRGKRSELSRALDAKAAEPPEVDDLLRMERIVTMSVGNAHDLHTRLLPLLRDIAATRLERAGHRPGPDTLGRWWELLRPDRPAPVDRFAPGIREAELRALVADLQKL